MPANWIFTRRHFVSAGAALGTALKLQRGGQAMGLKPEAGVCTLAAQQEIGPYYIADELLRSDIAEAKPGVPLILRINLMNAVSCKPLAHAAVDYLALRRIGSLLRIHQTASYRASGATAGLRSPTSQEPARTAGWNDGPCRGKPSKRQLDVSARYTASRQQRSSRVSHDISRFLHGPDESHPSEGAERRGGGRKNVSGWTYLAHRADILSRRAGRQADGPGAV